MRLMTLVGPAGSGKTTTMMKMAFASWKDQDSVLIHTDNFHLGSRKTYEGLDDLFPFPVAGAESDTLMNLVAGYQTVQDVYVDIGFNSDNQEDWRQLMTQVAKQTSRTLTVLLCLSAGTSSSAALHQAQYWSSWKPEALLVTKVDEAPLGSALEIVNALKLPLWAEGKGQMIPGDILFHHPSRPVVKKP